MKFQKILRKYIINNIGYKILAIVFSFLLWLVILNITDPEYTRTLTNIPVQIKNENLVLDGNHVYTIASGDVTNVIVTGKRSILSTLMPSDFLVTADFEELSITNAVPIKVELRSDKARYSSQISVSTRDNSMIINLEEMSSVQIPVALEYRGTPLDDIVIDEANLYPKKVTLSAPQSVTEAASSAIVTADYAEITSDTEMFLIPELRTEDGTPVKPSTEMSLDVDEIQVEFRTSRKKDVPVVVNFEGEPGPGYVLAGIELSQDSITLKGAEDILNELEALVLPSELVNISGATEDIYTEIDVTPYLPESVVVYGESPTIFVTAQIMSEEELKERIEQEGPQNDLGVEEDPQAKGTEDRS